jgi:hypothetical protein
MELPYKNTGTLFGIKAYPVTWRAMPYVSDQQRKFFHSAGAKKAGIKTSTVKEFDAASKGMKLPKTVKDYANPRRRK